MRLHLKRHVLRIDQTRPCCSKLMTLLVNVSLKLQILISEQYQYFLLKKIVRSFALQKLLRQKYQYNILLNQVLYQNINQY